MTDMLVNSVYVYWNNTPGLIHHKKLSHDIELACKSALKHYTVSEVHEAIWNYGMVLGNEKFFWTRRWTLGVFLTRKTGQCKDDPKQFWRFLENNFVKEDYLVNAPEQRKVDECYYCHDRKVGMGKTSQPGKTVLVFICEQCKADRNVLKLG